MKFLIFLLCHGFLLASTHVIDTFPFEIKTPQLSERTSQKFVLDNGMHVLAISDPQTPFSAAALCVEAGSFDDPESFPGLAHFVEHMLFMGTEKYPEEEEYQNFITQHGGLRNAFTTSDRTVYMFSIQNEAFDQALDRFAQFFIAPLFLDSCIERERLAVHQEYSRNLASDAWRSYHVKKHIANPDHPFSRFTTGSKETLGSVDRQTMVRWYFDHYSSDQMHLVLYSNDSLEQMEDLAKQLFNGVEKRETTHANVGHMVFLPEPYKTITQIYPLNDVKTLEFDWEVKVKENKGRPDKILSYILGHEGKGSIAQKLKEKGLAHKTSTSCTNIGEKNKIFSLMIDLTEKGVIHYDEIVETVFAALEALKIEKVSETLVSEIQTIAQLNYEFQQRENVFEYVTELAYLLPEESFSTFPYASLAPTCFDDAAIDSFLSQLTFENAHLFLIAQQNIESHTMNALKRQEPWMSVPYQVCYLSKDLIQKCSQPSPNFQVTLPKQNRFLPSDLRTKRVSQCNSCVQLQLVYDDLEGKFYYGQDERFGTPESVMTLRVLSPFVKSDSPKSVVMNDLFAATLTDHFNILFYEAKLAGLRCNIKADHFGLEFSFEGFSEKYPLLVHEVFSQSKDFYLSLDQFHRIKEQLAQNYYNLANRSVISQALGCVNQLIYKDHVTDETRYDELNTLDYADFMLFAKQYFDRGYIQSTYYGSLEKADVEMIWQDTLRTLKMDRFSLKDHSHLMVASFPKDKDPICIKKKSLLHGNALILTMQSPEIFNVNTLVSHQLLSTALSDSFFSELRTKQQTAYLVQNKALEIENQLYMVFLIQSSSHTPSELLPRFELFFESCLKDESLWISFEKFQALKEAFITSLKHAGENLAQLRVLLDKRAFTYNGDFNWNQKQVEALQALSYEQFLHYAQTTLSRENRRRVAVAISGKVLNEDRFEYKSAYSIPTVCKKLSYQPKAPHQGT